MTIRNPSLTELSSHFSFGENWASYAELIDEPAIVEAERGLVRLVGADGIRGRTFLDLGCGSGLHALAALRLGATRVDAIDIDPVAAKTAQAVLHIQVHVVPVAQLPLADRPTNHGPVVYNIRTNSPQMDVINETRPLPAGAAGVSGTSAGKDAWLETVTVVPR